MIETCIFQLYWNPYCFHMSGCVIKKYFIFKSFEVEFWGWNDWNDQCLIKAVFKKERINLKIPFALKSAFSWVI